MGRLSLFERNISLSDSIIGLSLKSSKRSGLEKSVEYQNFYKTLYNKIIDTTVNQIKVRFSSLK